MIVLPVIFRRKLFQFFGYQIADPAKFFVTEGVGGLSFENHLSALIHCAFGNQYHRIVTRIVLAVGSQQFREALDIKLCSGITQRCAAPAMVGSIAVNPA